ESFYVFLCVLRGEFFDSFLTTEYKENPIELLVLHSILHPCSQTLKRPELKLFDSALAAPQCLSNLAYALLFSKAHDYDLALIFYQLVNEAEKFGAALAVLDICLLEVRTARRPEHWPDRKGGRCAFSHGNLLRLSEPHIAF